MDSATRRAVFAALPALVMAGRAAAESPDAKGAEALVRAFYAEPDEARVFRRKAERYFTPPLARALKADAAGPEVGAIDFDIRSDSQDPQIKGLRFRSGQGRRGGMTVTALFTEYRQPMEVNYELVRLPQGWRIADVWTAPRRGEKGWRLTRLLRGAD